MEWLVSQTSWAKPLGIVTGAILAIWTLVGHIDQALVRHLDATFATKADVQLVEQKVDLLLKKLDAMSTGKK